MANIILVILLFAFFTERTLGWLVEPILKAIGAPSYAATVIAVAVGILLAFGLHLDALAALPFALVYLPFVGYLITGILIGGGHEAINAFFALVEAQTNAHEAAAVSTDVPTR